MLLPIHNGGKIDNPYVNNDSKKGSSKAIFWYVQVH